MKIIIYSFLIIISISSNSISEHFHKKWGVVVDVERIYYNKIISKPTTYKTCTNYRTSTPKIENVLLGGLIGSVIGNQISDVHGAGTMGAIFGSIVAADDRNIKTSCEYKSFYKDESRKVFSHYKITLRTKNGFKTINSSNYHNVHDVIYFN